MNRVLVIYDFDLVLTSEDSFKNFIEWYSGEVKTTLTRALLSPISLVGSIIGDEILWKDHMLGLHFEKMSEDEFYKICKRYALVKLPEIIIQDGVHSIKSHINDGDEVCVVSAGFAKYVEVYFNQLDVKVLGSSINCENEHPMMGLNCNYEEKLKVIIETYNIEEFEKIIVYGKSPETDNLMSIASERFYQPFEPEYPD